MKNKKSGKIKSIMLATLLILVYLGTISFVQAAPGDINISWQEPGESAGQYIEVTLGDSFRYDLYFDLENLSHAWQAQSASVNVEFRPAEIINYTSVAKGELTYDANVWITPSTENYSNSEGWFRNLAGSFNTQEMNNTAGTVANITWYANNVGVATIYHNASRTSYGGTAGDMNFLRTNGEVRVYPQTPTDYTMEDEGSTWFNMSWGSALGIDKYVIFRSDIAQPTEPTGSPIYNDTGLTYNNTGLDIEKDYYYSLWGWNETEGFYSLEYETLTKESTNALPSVFTATATGKTTIDLNWDCEYEKTVILRPSNNGSSTQWTVHGETYNWQAVLVNDGDDTRIQTNTNENWDSYEIEEYIIGKPIKEISIHAIARGDGIYKLTLFDGTIISKSENINTDLTYSMKSNTWELNPFTGEKWNSNDINELEIGIEHTDSGGESVRCTQLYLEITYYDTPIHVIERSESSDPWNQGVGDEIYNGTELSFNDVDLWPDTTYYYQLWTYYDGEYSSTYLQAHDTTDGNNAPVLSNEDPTNMTEDVDKMYSQVSVQINDLDGDTMTWTIEGAYITNTGDSSGNTTISADLITPLPYDTPIIWYVNVTDGFVSVNETFEFKVREEFLPLKPEAFKADTWDRTSINLTWTKVEFGEYVHIERSEINEPFLMGDGYLAYNGTGTYFDDTELDPNTEYLYQAWSYNATDNVYSLLFAFDVNTTDENTPPYVINASAELNKEIYTSVYNTYLNITVEDTDGDILEVTYYWGNHTTIAFNTEVEAGGYWNISLGDYFGPAWRQWLDHNVNYTWYAVIDDGFETFNTSIEHGLYWFNTSKAFDLNEDGTTDADDISLLVLNYGSEGYHPGELPADIMETGTVDVDDVSMFVSNFGWSN
jgi:hypothetical protein